MQSLHAKFTNHTLENYLYSIIPGRAVAPIIHFYWHIVFVMRKEQLFGKQNAEHTNTLITNLDNVSSLQKRAEILNSILYRMTIISVCCCLKVT